MQPCIVHLTEKYHAGGSRKPAASKVTAGQYHPCVQVSTSLPTRLVPTTEQRDGKTLKPHTIARYAAGKVDEWDVTALYGALAGCTTSPLAMCSEFDRNGTPNYNYCALRDAVPCGLTEDQLVTKLKDDTRNAVAHCSEIKTFAVDKLDAMVEVARTFANVLFPATFIDWSCQLDSILAQSPGSSDAQIEKQQRRIQETRAAADRVAVQTLLQPGPVARLHSEQIMKQKRVEHATGTREWYVIQTRNRFGTMHDVCVAGANL